MVFWMRKVARSIKSSLHTSLDHALAGSKHQVTALIAMVFFAVAREGLETVFFLLAVFQQSEGPAAPLGALLGLILAIFVGFAIYTGSMRLNLGLFFRWTGLFILVHAPVDYAGALVYGSMTYLLCVWSKNLGACVVMHATANLLMGLYAMAYGKYGLW